MEDIAFIDEIVTKEKHEKISKAKVIRIGIPHEGFYDDLAPEVEKIAWKSI